MTEQDNSIVLPYIFDLELSGRCNTHCSFCPRDEMKRGEDFMSSENFALFMERMREYAPLLMNRRARLVAERAQVHLEAREQSPLRVIMCGMGESLLHPDCVDWIGRIRRELGIRVTVVTNGNLLCPELAQRLAQAEVTVVLVSVPGVDESSYQRLMHFNFEDTLARISAARTVLGERVQVSASIPYGATFNAEDLIKFWQERGVIVAGLSRVHSRGGHLRNPELTGPLAVPPSHFCGIVARNNFIAWDGRILSCCHDLHGANVIGSLRQDTLLEIARRKTALYHRGPAFKICASCTDDERRQTAQVIAQS